MAKVQIESQKNRNGDYETGSYFVATNLTGKYTIGLDILLADLQNVTNKISFAMYVSSDNVTWKHYSGLTWNGGNYTDRLGNLTTGPGLTTKATAFVGRWVKAVMNFNQPMRVGIYIEQID